jgi:2-oxoglutarate ferredoxin oxidoreductase subunit alpha
MPPKASAHRLHRVNLRFAGDSGDGMQVIGNEFAHVHVLAGNDIFTLPDYPAEIRAPVGTPAGVSGFQISFADHEIHTPGDQLDVLVVMNPAALKTNLQDLKPNGVLIVNSDSLQTKEFKKAGYTDNPLQDKAMQGYQIFQVPITSLTLKSLEKINLSHSAAKKCKNMFALGLALYLFDRDTQSSLTWIAKKFAKNDDIVQANQTALKAGFNYGLITEAMIAPININKASLGKGKHRQMTGSQAIALACLTLAVKTKQSLLLAGYPITPASTILQDLANYQEYGIQVFQAEDEIAAVNAALGAAFGGSIGITCTSGPGLDLKAEGIGLAVMAELPMIIIDVQRAGPSTGLPTKLEQSDLLAAMYGRHGESPLPIVAPKSPSDCFDCLLQAYRLAIKYMTPVIFLSDASLANGQETCLVPEIDKLDDLVPSFHTQAPFSPYQRDEKLSRPWAIPGTKDLEHRIGGLEKEAVTGDVNYEPLNHQALVSLRENKIRGVANSLPELEIIGDGYRQSIEYFLNKQFFQVISRE